MVKMDAKFYGEIRKAKDDSIVPDDEYIVFLVKDNAVPAMLQFYRRQCEQLKCDAEQLTAVDRMIGRALAWRREHPDRIKNADAAGEHLLDVMSEK